MTSWLADADVRGYISGDAPVNDAYHLLAATAGTINLDDGGVTRLDKPGGDADVRAAFAFSKQNRMRATGVQIRFTSGDAAVMPFLGTNFKMGASLYVVPDGMFLPRRFGTGECPTPAEIRNKAIARGLTPFPCTTKRTTAGDLTTSIEGPEPGVTSTLTPYFNPNEKYWFMVLPTWQWTEAVTTIGGGGPLITYVTHTDLPFTDTDAWVNANGRAISLWTNRTPDAPVVTLSSGYAPVNANDTVTLTMVPDDRDKTSTVNTQRRDLAGVQVQYAAQPSADNPSPVWTDLPFANKTAWGSGVGAGWYITQSAESYEARDTAHILLSTLSVDILCGSTSPDLEKGVLPSGKWQIRVRTFDFGHPFPENAAIGPVGFTPGTSRTPDTYPALNTSPWSTPVKINVLDQCPPPVLLSPINGFAVAEGAPLTMIWRYRNTAGFTQAERLIEIRPLGESTWTTLVSGAGTDPFYEVPLDSLPLPLVPTTMYEWRVQVTDSDTVPAVSNYSEIGRFWIVPAPQTGIVKPSPATGDAAGTLGCGKHTIDIYRRGGLIRVGTLTQVSYIDWGRLRDDISTAKIVVSGWDEDCGNLLSQLQTWAYEVVITRDNGYSKDRVWEGPITLLTYKRDSVTIDAKDVMVYPYRRIIKQIVSDVQNGAPVTARAAQILQNVMAPDDPNVLAYLVVASGANDAVQYRYTPAYSRTAFEEVDDMAANAGLDYTAVGRSIILWSTRNALGVLPEFRDDDLGDSPIVSEYGMSMANVYAVSDGNGIFGLAVGTGSGLTTDGQTVSGNDEDYGLVELLSSTWAQDSTPESGTYTAEGLAKVRESFKKFSERSIEPRYPPPVVVRVPDNTSLNPSTALSIQHLIPGVTIPLRSNSTLRTVADMQKLDAVKVVETDGKETITITMSPFSDNGITVGDGGGGGDVG